MPYNQQSELSGQGVQLFTNPSFGTIRTAGDADNPLFCLADLCKALDLHICSVRQRLEKGVCSTYPLPTNGGTQRVSFVNEDGMFDVVLESRKPEARAFRKWVTKEVLPAIRRTGGYAISKPEPADDCAKMIMGKIRPEVEKMISDAISRITPAHSVRKCLAPGEYYLCEIARELHTSSENLSKLLISLRMLTINRGHFFPVTEAGVYFGVFMPLPHTQPEGIIINEMGRREILVAWPTYSRLNPKGK